MEDIHRGFYQFRQKLSVGYAILAGLLVSLLAWKISQADQASRDSELAMTGVIARSMAAHVADLVEAADQPLRKCVEKIGELDASEIKPSQVGALLSSTMGTGDSRFWFFYVDAHGVGLASSNGLVMGATSFADRPYYARLVASRGADYFVGSPLVGRLSGRRVFFLSRPVVSKSGQTRGVVVASIDAAKVADVFDLARLNRDMSITMAATDKKIIARAPLFEQTFGLDVASAVNDMGLLGWNGSLETVSPITGDRRIFSYARVGSFPMIVGVGLAREPWWAKMRGDLGVAVVALALLLTVAWLSGKLALLRFWRLEELEAEQRALLADMGEARRKLEISDRRLRAIMDNMPALVAYLDTEERFVFHNAADQKLTRYPSRTAQGKTVLEVYGPEIYATLRGDIRQALSGQRVKAERRYVDNGQELFFKHFYEPDYDAHGNVVGCYAMVTNITAFKQTQRRLWALNRVDDLTGLANRVELRERVEEALARCRRAGCALGCLYLDIDKFKEVNDTLGHAGGDAALVEFSRRLKDCVRQTDLVARLAGDEFVILLEGLEQPAEAERVAGKIIQAMEAPFDLNGTPRRVTTSIGAVAADLVNDNFETLLHKADLALYRAKRGGRNQAVGQGAAG
ncbi:diguanylate cyclase [Massilia forsythiae]|uniref:Diguanylate cyclase n=1 Tax=Massilia forsythiae TaxID=2728020 RepID=A0A7Z2W0H0_9BURK|nr:diguanylate cyclase [Massilia forsythiae]QJE02505.1 diguanylate cyclase [Massilia forsythiae]